ncbi:MAG: lipoate--protein ligase family protein [Thermoplasmata archaeon]|nr:lipoate--protein ligase family protein [Thermoplasmata archaeon]
MTEKTRWRLLRTGYMPGKMNMAVDEAVLEAVSRGLSPPTFRVYEWEPSAISIGYFQSMREEVDLDECRRQGVDVVRRITGGGAVFHDREGEVTYSIIFKEGTIPLPGSVAESYPILCRGLVEGLSLLGLDAAFSGVNDITVGGRKISGNAHTRKYGSILQHGTLLYDVRPRVMFSLLRVPSEKIRDKMITAVEERVTSIKRELGPVDIPDVEEALIDGFSTALGLEMEIGELSREEKERAGELAVEKYGSDEWNFKR